MWHLIYLAAFLSVFVACGDRSDADVTHTDEAHVASPKGAALHHVSTREAVSPPQQLMAIGDEGARVGTVEGDLDQVFGQIEDIAVHDSFVYVLDSHLKNLRAYGHEGNMRFSIGRSGEGPNEFRRPMSLTEWNDSVFVGDLGYSLAVYAPAPEGLAERRRIKLKTSPTDICIVGGELVVHGTSPEERDIIWVYTRAGQLLRSFGEGYSSSTPLINYQLSMGDVACFEGGTIVFAFDVLHEVRAYNPSSGDLRWVVRIDDLLPVEVSELDGGGYEVVLPDAGFHRLQSVVPLNPTEVLVQYVHVQDGDPASESETFLIDAGSGEARYLGRLPHISGYSASLLVTEQELPFTQLHLIPND